MCQMAYHSQQSREPGWKFGLRRHVGMADVDVTIPSSQRSAESHIGRIVAGNTQIVIVEDPGLPEACHDQDNQDCGPALGQVHLHLAWYSRPNPRQQQALVLMNKGGGTHRLSGIPPS